MKKIYLLAAILFSPLASFSSEFKDLTLDPVANQLLCVYEKSVSYAAFPDVEVYSGTLVANVWQKATNSVKTTVEILPSGEYRLHLLAAPGIKPEDGSPCPKLTLKLFVRN